MGNVIKQLQHNVKGQRQVKNTGGLPAQEEQLRQPQVRLVGLQAAAAPIGRSE